MSQNHVVTLRALEVLQLIADRLERHDHADVEDIQMLLAFFREVSPETFDNHPDVHGLLDELETCFKESCFDNFVVCARNYTRMLGDVILRAEFAQASEDIAGRVRAAGPAVRRLESKYVNPHCI